MANITGTAGNNTLLGTAAVDTIRGLGGNDRLEGRGGNDRLDGGAGNDTLIGGPGVDLLIGGAGNDTYVIDNATEINKNTTDAGIDTVQSSVTYTLGAQQEHLTLSGTAALNGTGNTGANTLLGNTGNNTLNGQGGNDTLTGNNGNDTLTGVAGNDTLNGGAGNDTLNGGTGNDRLLGGGGNDVLTFDVLDTRGVDGGAGTDTLKISGGVTADFVILNSGTARFLNIEVIDLNAAGVQTVNLDEATLLGLSGTDILTIRGAAGDVVTAAGDWINGGMITLASIEYQVWTSGDAELRIQTAIDDSSLHRAPDAMDDSGTGFGTDEDTAFTTGTVLANDTDANGDLLSVSGADASSVAGVAITNNGDGTFGYDPGNLFDSLGVGESTTDTFTYTVSDGHGSSDTATVTVTITGQNEDISADDDALSMNEDDGVQDITSQVLAGDVDPDSSDIPTITGVDATGTLGGLILAGGGLSYSPNGAFNSLSGGETTTDTFTYTVSDGHGTSDTATVTVTITGQNDELSADDDALTVNEDDGATDITGTVLDGDVDPDTNDEKTVVAVDATGVSGAVTLVEGVLSYNPNGQFDALAVGETATETFSYTVSDGHGSSDTATVTVTVTGQNDEVNADDDGLTVGEDDGAADITGVLLAGDSDPDGSDILAITGVDGTGTLGGLTLGGGGLSYSPNGAFESLADGETATDSFTYTLSDGQGSTDTATVTVTITGVNDDVNADDDTASVDEDATTGNLASSVLSNDDDADASDTPDIIAVTQGGKGSVTWDDNETASDSTDDTLTYTADHASLDALADGETTTDTFTYTISDGQGSTDTATVTVTITGVNDDPDADNDTASVNEDATTGNLETTVLTGDTDIDNGSNFAITSVTQGTNGAVVFNDGGTAGVSGDDNLTYAATGSALDALASGETTTDTFTYTITDNLGATDTATVTVTITGINDTPVIAGDLAATLNEGATYTLTTTDLGENDPDDSGAGLTYKVTSLTDNGVLKRDGTTLNLNDTFTAADVAGSLVTYEHNGGETLSDDFGFTLADDGEDSAATDSDTFTFTVTAVNDAPVIAGDLEATLNEGATYTLTTTDLGESDPDDSGADLTYKVTNLTDNGVLKRDGTTLNLNDTFTAADVAGSLVTYEHNGGETTSDGFGFTLADGGEDGAATDSDTFTFTVTAVNDTPVIAGDLAATLNEGATYTLTTTDLGENDPDDSGVDLTYKVTSLTDNGVLKRDGTTLNLNDTFTAADVADSLVTYEHNGGETTSDDFGFTLADGGEDSAATDSDTFTFTVTAVNDTPEIAGDLAATLNEGATYTLTTTDLGESDPDDSGADLTYKVTNLTDNGVLKRDGTTLNLNDTFTAADVAGSLVTYVHNGGETTSDGFGFTLADGGEDGAATDSDTFTFTVTAVNDAPVNTVPGEQDASLLQNKTITGISVADIDGGSFEIILSTDAGSLSLNQITGLTFISGDGSADESMRFTGSTANVNAALANLTFHATQAGEATITLNTNDQGFSGSGGNQSDIDTITVNVSANVPLETLDGENGFRLDGIDVSDFSGRSVSAAGDVNGDGFADLIVGADRADPGGDSGAGESYVVFGKSGGFASFLDLGVLNGTNGFRLDGIDADDFSGHSVSSAGDVNGDGYDDLLVGAFGADPNGSQSGETYVVFGGGTFASALSISAVNGSNGFRLEGIDADDQSGWSVSSAEDVNGDGLDDLIIGAQLAVPNGAFRAGETYVVFGKSDGFASFLDLSVLNGTDGFRLDGIDASDYSGWSVSAAGDVNGDGLDDLLIGAFRGDPNGDSAAGESYVVFGKSGGFASSLDLGVLNGTNGFRLDGINTGDYSGWSVSSAGDVNNDGVDDVIIGARSADPNVDSAAGESYVVFGQAGGFASFLDLGALNGTNGFRLDGIDVIDFSGGSVSSAGDVNGDGFDDLIIGALGADPNGDSYAGESYVVFGQAGGFASFLDLGTLDGTNGFRIDGIDTGDQSGVSVSSAGDVNGDGFYDLIIGAIGADPNGNSYAGESYVIFGTDFRGEVDFLGGTGNDSFTGTSAHEILIGGLGNDTLNGGAGNDVLNGAAGNDVLTFDVDDLHVDGGSGMDTAAIAGSTVTLDLTDVPANVLHRIEAIDLTGTGDNTLIVDPLAVLNLSDSSNTLRVLGDSGDEVQAGTGWFHIGAVSDGEDTYAQYQQGAAILEVDTDITRDITLGDTVNLSSLSGLNGFQVNGEAAYDLSGYAVRSAGDVNADGYADLLIGAHGRDTNGAYAGSSYVVFGKASGFSANLNLSTLNGTTGFEIIGETTDDAAGFSVSSAGDVNGDGYADLLIGAFGRNTNGSDAGASYVVFGKASGFSANLELSTLTGADGFEINGEATGDHSSSSVSGAGDVNGDGFDDLLISARFRDINGTDAGAAYVVFGKASGFTANLNLAALDGNNGFELNGETAQDIAGYSVSGAGDVNGDGYADLLIGADGRDINGTDAGASYVVFGNANGFSANLNLGTLDGTTGFELNGAATGDNSGVSVASAGDVNGDGLDDLVIGTHGRDINGTDAGASYIVFGTESGFLSNLELSALNGTDGFEINGESAGDNSGRSVSNAGDVNGDGYDDLLIGAYKADANGADSGSAYVIYGKASGFSSNLDLSALDGTNGFEINGAAASDYFGRSVSAAGDVNGDGFDDLIVGADRVDINGSNAGASYVLFGGDFRSEVDFLGTSGSETLTGTGDANIVIGDLGNDTLDGGAGIDVLRGAGGNDTLTYDSADLLTDGGAGNDTLIINGSGVTLDLTAAAETNVAGIEIVELTGSGNNTLNIDIAGLVQLTEGIHTLRVEGDTGDSVNAGSGWFHAENFEDGGQTYARYVQGGAVLEVDTDVSRDITFGQDEISLNSLVGLNGFKLYGESANDVAGFSVSDAGDVNGDGYDDLLISAHGPDVNGNNAGSSYVVFGKSGAFNATVELSALNGVNGFQLNGETAGDLFGYSVSSAGDVNGDGYDDLLIGAPVRDVNATDAGAAYVVFGKASAFSSTVTVATLNGANGFELNGEAAAAVTGYFVSSAGDVNGDGYDDLLIGAHGRGVNGVNSGSAYVVFGKESGFASTFDLATLNGSDGFEVSGETGGDLAGYAVSSAGDINGDGYADLLIGASSRDFNAADAGTTYVVFGMASGFASHLQLSDLNGTNGFELNGESAGDNSGRSVAGAGDVNGDGYDDIVIGAFGRDSNGADAGTAYVILGQESGFTSSFELSLLNGTNGFQVTGESSSDFSGFSVSSAGDVNGDGYGDLLISAHGTVAHANGGSAGSAYLVFGTGAGFASSIELSALNGTDGFEITGENAGDLAGHSVSGAGDVDGDGFDDLLIGAWGNDTHGTDSGAAYVLFGGNFTNAAETDDTLIGTAADELLVGGLGNDTLDGGAGNDVLRGAAGDDTLVYDSADGLRVDGGVGIDTLQITGSGVNINLTTINATEHYALYRGIEVIDLTGTGNNTLTLNTADLLRLSDNSDILRVAGDAGDNVIAGTDWTQINNININSQTYTQYIKDGVTLQVNVHVTRTLTTQAPQVFEIQVNTTTASDQGSSVITTLTDGDYVVAWISFNQDGSSYGIYAQRHAADGAAVGAEFRVNTTTTDIQYDPVVTALTDGGFVVAWASDNQDGSGLGVYAQRYATDGAAVGAEFRVNTTTVNEQHVPSITALADGGFLVTWVSYPNQDGDQHGIYAQRYGADGAAVGSEFLVNTTTVNTQYGPATTALTGGGFLVTWSSYSQDGSADGIYAQRFGADGTPVGTEFRVNTTTPYSQSNPATTTLTDGGFVVTWTSENQDGSSYGIYAQSYDNDGTAVGSEFRVNTTTQSGQFAPTITALADGGFVVAWFSDNQDGSSYGVYAQRYGDDGTPVGAEFRVNTTTVNQQVAPAITGLTDGGFIVTWTSSGQDGSGAGIYAQRFDADGNPVSLALEGDGGDNRLIWTGNHGIFLDGGAGNDTLIGNADDGTFIGGSGDDGIDGRGGNDSVLYSGSSGGYSLQLSGTGLMVTDTNSGDGDDGVDTIAGIEYLTFTDGTIHAAALGEFQVNTSTSSSFSPAVTTALTDGGYLMTWLSLDGSGYGIYAQRYGADGAAVGAEFRVNSTTADGQYGSATTALTEGGFVVTWTSNNQDGSSSGIYAQRYGSDGVAVGSEFRVNATTANTQYDPAITALADGGFVVTWTSYNQDSPFTYGIYAQRFDTSGAVQGGETLVNTTTANSQDESSTAALADGGFVVTWTSSGQDGFSDGIYAQRYGDDGMALGGEFRVNTTTVSDQNNSATTALTDGGFVVTWMSDNQDGSSRGIYAQRYDENGATAGAEFRVNTTTAGSQESPATALLADGGFVVAWMSLDGNSYGIYAQRYATDGTPVGAEFLVNTTTQSNQFYPSITALTDGGFVVAWSSDQQDGINWDIYAQRYDAGGNPVSALQGDDGDNHLNWIGSEVVILNGGAGEDMVSGGSGLDTLIGGADNDIFLFNDATGATNVDTIMDFGGAGATALDVIHLDNAIFDALTTEGALDPGRFVSGVGPTPADADDHILYDTSTGQVYYDPTGNVTGGDAVLIAVIATDPDELSAADFVVI